MNKVKPELLAPAQNLDVGKVAILSGADAVYIGAYSFGARKNAGNSLDDIKELINFAHLYNARVHVTLNTILTDKELVEAEKLVNKLYEIGADALIIQDMGLLELDLPPLELHASTQCNIRTKEKAKFFEEIGIKRAILARELSIKQIEEISKYTNIELETFIHGALCVSYSGQCYMSAYNGSRSANRGDCAQCCRMKYSLLTESGKVIAKDKHLLSLKDFCAKDYLDKLIQAGVKSFKIEGRLKDENYVKNVVLYYRNLLNKYEKPSDGLVLTDFKPDINKTFNRGYTTYFLSGEDEIFNFETPKSTGEYMGEVKSVSKQAFTLSKSQKISPQDGLLIISKNKTEGFLVNKTENGEIFPNKHVNIKVGDKIYRNKNVEFENLLKNAKIKRVIFVEISVYKDYLEGKDGNFKVTLPFKFESFAKNEEKMKENFRVSFKKSGESVFSCDKVNFETDKIPFLSMSELNNLRRELFQKMQDERLKNYQRPQFGKIKYSAYKEKIQDYRLNIHNKKAEEFYEKCGVRVVEKSLESTGNFKNKELMRTKHCLRRAYNICLKTGCKNESLYLTDNNKKYILEFDCKNCEMVIKPLK